MLSTIYFSINNTSKKIIIIRKRGARKSKCGKMLKGEGLFSPIFRLLRLFNSTFKVVFFNFIYPPTEFFISALFLISKSFLKRLLIDSILFLCIQYIIVSLRLMIVSENFFSLKFLFPLSFFLFLPFFFLSFLFQLYSRARSSLPVHLLILRGEH